MASIDELFAGMATADVNGKGTYMNEGLFVVETKNIFVKDGKNPAKPGSSFICEFVIIESNNPAHAVGSSGSYVLKLSNPYAMGNVVELMIALLGYANTKENQKDATIRQQADIVARAACGSDTGKKQLEELRAGLGADYGTIIGKRLRLETKKTPTSKPGGEYTVHKWSPVKAIAVAA